MATFFIGIRPKNDINYGRISGMPPKRSKNMDALTVNEQLNLLKDKYPGDVALVESVQTLFNKEVKIISDRSIRALKSFPMQFTKRIPTKDGEWTTQLHIWADNQVPELLEIDPLVLTAKNSDGECVLMSLLMAATGRFTQQVNYPLIQKMLDTNMDFEFLTEPGNEDAVEYGNVWDEEDYDHKTPLEYLADFAKGTGPFLGFGGDATVREMLEAFADKPEMNNPAPEPQDSPATAATTPAEIPPANPAPSTPVQQPVQQPLQQPVQQPVQQVAETPQIQQPQATQPLPPQPPVQPPTQPEPEHTEPSIQEKCKELISDVRTNVNNSDAMPIAGNGGEKHLLEALVTIGKNLLFFG